MTAPPTNPLIAGLVLAGGAGVRIGGAKPAVCLAGRTLMDHAAAILAPQCSRLAICVHGIDQHDALPAQAAGRPVAHLADPFPERRGPLAGVLAGLRWAAGWLPPEGLVLTIPVDMPFLPHDLANRLEAGLADAQAAVASDGDRCVPVIALYRLSARAAIEDLLRREPAPSVRRLLDRICARPVVVAPTPQQLSRGIDPLFNINTPDDLARARRVLDGPPEPPEPGRPPEDGPDR